MNNKFLYRIVFLLFVLSFAASIFYVYNTNFATVPLDINDIIFKLTYTKKLNEKNRIGLGVYIPNQEATNFSSVLDFEELVDKKMEYSLFFRAWGDADNVFPTHSVPYLKKYNLTPIITWEPWRRNFSSPETIQPQWALQTIVDGKHDDYIRTWAEAARDAELPIIIRFAHEMTSQPGLKIWYPWQGEPENYVAAFQRIVQIFRIEGAHNVEFMWNPISYDPEIPYDEYYPGNTVVDYIGITLLSSTTTESGVKRLIKCEITLEDQYLSFSKYRKPVIIAEMIAAATPDEKAEWYQSCFDKFDSLSLLRGLISVQVSKNDRQPSRVPADWRVNSDPGTLEVFKNGIKNGDFK